MHKAWNFPVEQMRFGGKHGVRFGLAHAGNRAGKIAKSKMGTSAYRAAQGFN
jgi:hypothetical protein